MIFELSVTKFDRVLSLFDKDLPNRAMAFSTLEGRTPGKLYVDDVDKPTACLLVINFHNLTFPGGTIEQPWLNWAMDELRQEQEVNLVWSAQIANRVEPPSAPVVEIDRFEFFDCLPQSLPDIPKGYSLQYIDAELFTRCLWYDEMILAFGTAENFLRNGLGICLMIEHEICSEAYAAFQGAGKCELGAVTHDRYRNRGYAYLTCKHLIKLCTEKGSPTCWSCHQNNRASVATARKLGYQTQKAYKFLCYSQNHA